MNIGNLPSSFEVTVNGKDLESLIEKQWDPLGLHG